jgi:hypothetical protein
MEPGNLENLMEKVRVVAQGPQADLLSKFVDLLYKPGRERPGQAAKAGRQSGGKGRRSRTQG